MPQTTVASLSPETLQWVLASFAPGDTVHSVAILHGGISARVYLVQIQQKNGLHPVVLRQFTDRDWLQRQPDLATREASSLQTARLGQVATPQLIAVDKTGEQCGIPSVLMAHLPGQVVLQPADFTAWLTGMAEALVRIHEIEPPTAYLWQYYTYNDIPSLEVPVWSDQPSQWEQALSRVKGPRPEVSARFIHRDYHPTNILWQEGHVSGVVDWVNACIGPRGIDVGHCRLNLALLHGVEVADGFLQAYQSLAGEAFAYDPYWDLVSLIEFLPGPPSVYGGWTALGVTHLTDTIIHERIEAYLASLLKKDLPTA